MNGIFLRNKSKMKLTVCLIYYMHILEYKNPFLICVMHIENRSFSAHLSTPLHLPFILIQNTLRQIYDLEHALIFIEVLRSGLVSVQSRYRGIRKTPGQINSFAKLIQDRVDFLPFSDNIFLFLDL